MWTTLTASQLGCALDCANLLTGLKADGITPATDDAPLISAYLSGATPASPRRLVLDGFARVTGVLGPYGCSWSIEGIGRDVCGLSLDSNTVQDVIRNGVTNPSDPGTNGSTSGTAAPARAGTVSISNLTIVGSRGGRTAFYGADYAPCGINLVDIDEAVITNVKVYDPLSYHVRISNFSRAWVTGCHLESPTRKSNTDGTHFNGPFDYALVSGNYLATGDDATAINCPEGWGGNGGRVVITGNVYDNCLTVCRAYSSTASSSGSTDGLRLLHSVNISNCSGSVYRTVLAPGEYTGSLTDSIGSIQVTDSTFETPCMVLMAANVGTLSLRGVKWISPAASPYYQNAWIANYTAPWVASHISIDNCDAYLNAAGNAAPSIVACNDPTNIGAIGTLDINGLRIRATSGTSYAPANTALNISSGCGSIGTLNITSLDATGYTTIGNSASVTTYKGSGLLSCGFALPDTAMANLCPFMSSTTNLPSIKVGGAVHAIALS